MTAKYWIKLYHEMLHDRKVAELDNLLWRRFVECLLFAGEMDNDGFLPSVEDMAWTIRESVEQTETSLNELVRRGFLQVIDGTYHVRNFSKRQEKMEKAEYMRRKRSGKQRDQYYKEELPSSYQPVTNSNADTDKKRKETEGEAEEEGGFIPSNSPDIAAERVYTDVTGQMTFPGNKRDDTLGALRTLIAYKGNDTADYLRPFYTEWCARKYNKGNTAWLTDWAVSGEIPPARRNGKSSEPKGFAGIREYLEEIENEQNNG